MYTDGNPQPPNNWSGCSFSKTVTKGCPAHCVHAKAPAQLGGSAIGSITSPATPKMFRRAAQDHKAVHSDQRSPKLLGSRPKRTVRSACRSGGNRCRSRSLQTPSRRTACRSCEIAGRRCTATHAFAASRSSRLGRWCAGLPPRQTLARSATGGGTPGYRTRHAQAWYRAVAPAPRRQVHGRARSLHRRQ